MNGIDIRLFGDANDCRDIQIGPNRFARLTDLIGLIRLEAMQRVTIFVGVNRHRPNMQLMS